MGGARPHLGAQTPGERRPLRLFVCAEGGGGGGGREGRAGRDAPGRGGAGDKSPFVGARGGGRPLRHRHILGGGFPLLSPPAGALPGCRRGRAGRGVPCVLGGGLRGSRWGAASAGDLAPHTFRSLMLLVSFPGPPHRLCRGKRGVCVWGGCGVGVSPCGGRQGRGSMAAAECESGDEKFSAVPGGGSFLLPTRKNNSSGTAVFA